MPAPRRWRARDVRPGWRSAAWRTAAQRPATQRDPRPRACRRLLASMAPPSRRAPVQRTAAQWPASQRDARPRACRPPLNDMESWEVWHYLVFLLAGVMAGFVNVMAGGGSLLSVPIMLFMGVPGPVANGTNRIAILAQMITGVFAFLRHGYSDFRLSLTLALAALPGAVLGAAVGARFEGIWFNRAVAALMLVVMLVMAFGKEQGAAKGAGGGGGPSKPRLVLAHVLVFFVGIYGGFIQIGVGLLFLPVLQRTLGLDLVRVNMHKTFIIAVYTVAALAVFASQVEIYWLLGLALALGTSIGAWLSARAQVAGGERVIKVALNIVLALFIVKLLFFS